MNNTIFEGRSLLIATMHEKEKVLAPLFEEHLKVKCFTLDILDTDQLGTFSGEIEREGDAISTARKKIDLALQHVDCDLVVASEGSFGAHPSVFFSAADEELLLLVDTKNNLEIRASILSFETNFNGKVVNNLKELFEFATKAGFPSHGLILRKQHDDVSEIVKGITDWQELVGSFHDFISRYGTAFVETDMRAMFNPLRMKVIGEAGLKLIAKLQSECPDCKTPGFDVTEVITGLPCEWCHCPTASTLAHKYSCKNCNYSSEKKFPYHKQLEDPMYCEYCNP